MGNLNDEKVKSFTLNKYVYATQITSKRRDAVKRDRRPQAVFLLGGAQAFFCVFS